jgi:hypothetical protein
MHMLCIIFGLFGQYWFGLMYVLRWFGNFVGLWVYFYGYDC